MNCCVVPSAIEGSVGVTSIETSTAALTESVVLSPMLLVGSTATTELNPTPTLFSITVLPPSVINHVSVVVDLPMMTELVMSCVLASLYVPIAVNCCVVPSAIEGSIGVTASDPSTAGEIVMVVLPPTLLAGSVAVIVVKPTATLVASP